MTDFLLQRGVVIALAVAGAVLSTAASLLRGRVGERGARGLNYAGYAFMGLSMVLFVLAGFRGPRA